MNDQLTISDVLGYNEVIEYNYSKNVLAYSIDNIIVLHDIKNSNKTISKYHKSKIKSMKFSVCENYLFSLDCCDYPVLALWKISIEKDGTTSNFENSKVVIKLLDHLELQVLKSNNFMGDINNISNNLYSTQTIHNVNIIADFKSSFIEQHSKDSIYVLIQSNNIQIAFMFELTYKNEMKLIYNENLSFNKIEPSNIPILNGLTTTTLNYNYLKETNKDLKEFKVNNKSNIKSNINNKNVLIYASTETHFIILSTNISYRITKIKYKISVPERIKNKSLKSCNSKQYLLLITLIGNIFIFDTKGHFIISYSPQRDYVSEISNNVITCFNTYNNILYYTELNNSIKAVSLDNFNEVMSNPFSENNQHKSKHKEIEYLNIKNNIKNKHKKHNNKNLELDDYYIGEYIYANQEKNLLIIKNYKLNMLSLLNIDKTFNIYSSAYSSVDNKINKRYINHRSNVNKILTITDNCMITIGSEILLWEIYENNDFIVLDYYDLNDQSIATSISLINDNSFIVGNNTGYLLLFEFSMFFTSKNELYFGNFQGNLMNLVSKMSTQNNKAITSLLCYNNKIIMGLEDGCLILTEYDIDNQEFIYCCKLQESFITNMLLDYNLHNRKLSSYCYILKKDQQNNQISSKNRFIVYGNEKNKTNCIRLIELNERYVVNNRTNIKSFNVDILKDYDFADEVVSIDVHKESELYFVVRLRNNTILIIHIESSKLCGSIYVESNKDIYYIIDTNINNSSGLYMLVQLYNETQKEYLFRIYEFGTGNLIQSIKNTGMIYKYNIINNKIVCFFKSGNMYNIDLPPNIKHNINQIKSEILFDSNFWYCFPFDFGEKSDKQFTTKKLNRFSIDDSICNYNKNTNLVNKNNNRIIVNYDNDNSIELNNNKEDNTKNINLKTIDNYTNLVNYKNNKFNIEESLKNNELNSDNKNKSLISKTDTIYHNKPYLSPICCDDNALLADEDHIRLKNIELAVNNLNNKKVSFNIDKVKNKKNLMLYNKDIYKKNSIIENKYTSNKLVYSEPDDIDDFINNKLTFNSLVNNSRQVYKG